MNDEERFRRIADEAKQFLANKEKEKAEHNRSQEERFRRHADNAKQFLANKEREKAEQNRLQEEQFKQLVNNARTQQSQQRVVKGVFEKAWRILKMTPEEMEAAGFHDAAAQMRQMQAEEERIKQQTQDTAPQMTPQIQANYQDQIDLKRQKQIDAQQIRRVTSGGRINSKQAKTLVQQYRQKYGEDPPRVSKTLRRRS